MSQPRIAAGVPRGGQFAPSSHAEADLMLVEQPVEVLDSSGNPVEVTPGVLDDNADWVYHNGQCLALAVAISERTGWPVHLRTFVDGPADPAGTYTSLRHAYVQAPDGSLIDVRGQHDADIVDEECRDLDGDLYQPARIVSAERAAALLSEFDGFLERQDVDVARSFVDPVLAQVEPTSPPAGPAPSYDQASEWAQDYFDTADGEPYARCCQDSEWASGMCCEVSESFADYLHSIGETSARTVDLDATEEHPYVHPGQPHTVVEVRGMIVDLTHRQFDPDASVPHAVPSEEFLAGWRVVSYD